MRSGEPATGAASKAWAPVRSAAPAAIPAAGSPDAAAAGQEPSSDGPGGVGSGGVDGARDTVPRTVIQCSDAGFSAPSSAATSSSSISMLVTQVRSGIGWLATGEPAVTTWRMS